MLTHIIHNNSGPYQHKLIKQRNLHVVIHNIAEQMLLLLFRLEMQTHNRSVRLSISVIFQEFSAYICYRDRNVILSVPIMKIYWCAYKSNAVLWHLLAVVASHQAISLHPSLAGY